MMDRGSAIEETLPSPEQILESLFDSEVRLYCRFYRAGVEAMARDRVRMWYDVEGDYLEVLFDQCPGYFRETANGQVLEKVDTQGNVLGFSVQTVSAIRIQPLDVAL